MEEGTEIWKKIRREIQERISGSGEGAKTGKMAGWME